MFRRARHLRQLVRGVRVPAAGLLASAVLFGPAVLPAAAADSTPTASDSASTSGEDGADGPTEAGTSFRTAAAVKQDQEATADASTGDYLYWSFPADAGQRPTVRASVKLPSAPATTAASTWRIDVYDGLRRRQACMYGMQTRTAAPDAGTVALSCTLRPVRAAAEPWANDPLPGTYYVRLTAVALAPADVGRPVQVSVEAGSHDVGGKYAVGGALGKPLVPGISMTARSGDGDGDDGSADGSEDSEDSGSSDDAVTLAEGEPDGGWSSGWWTDRWLWTGAGGILAALAGVGGYRLTRGRRHT